MSLGKWTLCHTQLPSSFWNSCFSKPDMGSSFAFFPPLLLAIISVFDTNSELSLRLCFTICLLLRTKQGSLFSQYFKGLGINLNSNCKDDRRKLFLTKTGGIKTLSQHTCFQELHWIEISKDSSFTSENSKCISCLSGHCPEFASVFWLVIQQGSISWHVCAKWEECHKVVFLALTLPTDCSMCQQKNQWHAFHFKRQIHYMPENSKNILFNVATKKISKIWSMKQFYQINHVHSWCVWLYLDYLLYKDHYSLYKTVTY